MRKITFKLGLSESTAKFLEESCTNSTWKQYDTCIKRWIQFCKEKLLDPFEDNVFNVISFLEYLYNLKLSYMSINTARSALSTVFVNRTPPLGEERLVTRFMKGVSKLRPPRARYQVTWDASTVLNAIKNLDDSFRSISMKTVALLALATGQRVQTIASIKLSNIVWGEHVQIKLPARLKTTSVNNKNPILIVPPFHDKLICPYEALRSYIAKSSQVRNGNDNLFLSYVAPFKAVTSQTISRWLCDILKLSNVQENFKAHSFRHASTSKALNNGINVDTILKHVGWSSSSNVFARHYNRPIEKSSSYVEAVFN